MLNLNQTVLSDGFKALIDKLSLDVLLVDTHPGVNEETMLSMAVSHGTILLLRPDQQDSDLCDIPVIMISALDEVESVARCIEMGAEDYLPKSINSTVLRARINASLTRKFFRDRKRAYLHSVEWRRLWSMQKE